MKKTFKAFVYAFCVSVLLLGVSSCKSQPEPKPEPKPEPVEPITNEQQEQANRVLGELDKVRTEAVSVQADTAYPIQFKAADDTAANAKRDYEAKNFSASLEKAQKAVTQYRTLINLMHIAALKAKIDKNDLAAYDADNYKKAEELAAAVPGLYESNLPKALKDSEQALSCYEAVKEAGFAALMENAKKKADHARERCDSVKAAAAMKDDYDNTVLKYRSAGVAAGSKKYEKAYNTYMTAADEFDTIYEAVKVKRANAYEAMERARARQEASSQLAKDADREAPLPENAEGFSEEPVDLEELQQSITNNDAQVSDNGGNL